VIVYLFARLTHNDVEILSYNPQDTAIKPTVEAGIRSRVARPGVKWLAAVAGERRGPGGISLRSADIARGAAVNTQSP
jgi:hypothetical protein